MRNLTDRIITPICILIILSIHGCGWKPYPRISEDITIPQILDTIDKQTSNIHDFTGNAFLEAKLKGVSPQNVKLAIKYVKPDRFRILIKGFAGIPVALITTSSDSITIYFPSENTYLTTGYGDDVLRALIPGIQLDFNRIASILTGLLPSQEERSDYTKSLDHYGRNVVLTLKKGTMEHCYTIEGKEMRVVKEKIVQDGMIMWEKKVYAFSNVDGILFARKLSMQNERGIMDIEFSGYSFNTGLTENDTLFDIPITAEKIMFPGKDR